MTALLSHSTPSSRNRPSSLCSQPPRLPLRQALPAPALLSTRPAGPRHSSKPREAAPGTPWLGAEPFLGAPLPPASPAATPRRTAARPATPLIRLPQTCARLLFPPPVCFPWGSRGSVRRHGQAFCAPPAPRDTPTRQLAHLSLLGSHLSLSNVSVTILLIFGLPS